jgi:hypothetical protein
MNAPSVSSGGLTDPAFSRPTPDGRAIVHIQDGESESFSVVPGARENATKSLDAADFFAAAAVPVAGAG